MAAQTVKEGKMLARRMTVRTKKAHVADALLIDALDGQLDPKTRARVEAHLSACPVCRKKFDDQQAWLDLVNSSELAGQAQTAWDEARPLRLDAHRLGPAPVPKKRPAGWPAWLPATSVAAALLVLLVAIPLVYRQTFPEKAAAPADAASDLLEETFGQSPVQGLEQAEINQQPGPWQLHKGPLADLPALALFFEDVTESLPEPDPSDPPDTYAQHATSLNERGKAFFRILEGAELVQVAVQQEPGQALMILAAYDTGNLAQAHKELAAILRTCQTSARLEIIKEADLPARLDDMEAGLAKRLLPVRETQARNWMMILIGA